MAPTCALEVTRELAERLVGCRRFDPTKAWILDEHRKVKAGA